MNPSPGNDRIKRDALGIPPEDESVFLSGRQRLGFTDSLYSLIRLGSRGIFPLAARRVIQAQHSGGNASDHAERGNIAFDDSIGRHHVAPADGNVAGQHTIDAQPAVFLYQEWPFRVRGLLHIRF